MPYYGDAHNELLHDSSSHQNFVQDHGNSDVHFGIHGHIDAADHCHDNHGGHHDHKDGGVANDDGGAADGGGGDGGGGGCGGGGCGGGGCGGGGD